MLKSTIKAVLINRDSTETPVQIVFSDMEVSSELAEQIMEGMLEKLPEFKTYTDGEVKISDTEEFPFAREKKDEQTIFNDDVPDPAENKRGKGKKKDTALTDPEDGGSE